MLLADDLRDLPKIFEATKMVRLYDFVLLAFPFRPIEYYTQGSLFRLRDV